MMGGVNPVRLDPQGPFAESMYQPYGLVTGHRAMDT
jgi:hypothetical protein